MNFSNPPTPNLNPNFSPHPLHNSSVNQEDSDDETTFSEALPIGNSKIEFQYYVKGAIGKKYRCLLVELESQSIILSNDKTIPVHFIVNTSKIPSTPGIQHNNNKIFFFDFLSFFSNSYLL